jgi:hypothetical protein
MGGARFGEPLQACGILPSIMRSAGWAALFSFTACPCGTAVQNNVYECETDAQCADGYSCLSGICAMGSSDAGVRDDAGEVDSGAVDSGSFDAGTVDSGLDGGPVDAGRPDAAIDAGSHDAGSDSGFADSGREDAGADAGCAPPKTDCSGSCVDLSSDINHCGTCTTACTAGNDCCTGHCVDLASDPANCGACGEICASGSCGTSLPSWSAAPALWRVNGTAHIADGGFGPQTGILTVVDAGQAGTLIYKNPIVTDSFTATFSFYIDGGTGADGFGFMIETNGPTAVGGAGGDLGMGGLSGYGVEFDTYDNRTCQDGNHVAIDVLTGPPDSGCVLQQIVSSPILSFSLRGTPHQAVIQMTSGSFTISIDGTQVLTGSVPKFVFGTSYYYGFGGGTGGLTDLHEVSPALQVIFPTPRCL